MEKYHNLPDRKRRVQMVFEGPKTILIGNGYHLYKLICKVDLDLISLPGKFVFIMIVSIERYNSVHGPYQRNVNTKSALDAVL